MKDETMKDETWSATIHRNVLAAALCAVPKEDPRKVLLGVSITPAELAATDGHKLFRFRPVKPFPGTVILPAELIRQALKVPTKLSGVLVTVDEARASRSDNLAEKPVTLRPVPWGKETPPMSEAPAVSGWSIGGRYPQVEQIIPGRYVDKDAPFGETFNVMFEPDTLAFMADVAKKLAGKDRTVIPEITAFAKARKDFLAHWGCLLVNFQMVYGQRGGREMAEIADELGGECDGAIMPAGVKEFR